MPSFHRALALVSAVCLTSGIAKGAAAPDQIHVSLAPAPAIESLAKCGAGSFALSASPMMIPVGSTFDLTWCDPSYFISSDAAYSVSSYSLYGSGSPGGPFSLELSGISSGLTGLSNIGITNGSAGDTLYLFLRSIGTQTTVGGAAPQNIDSNVVHVTLTGSNPTGCSPDSTTLCLFNRFKATAKFRRYNSSTMETASARGFSDTTGFFSTVLSSDVDVVVKMVNFCSLNGTWAAYIGGTTDLEVDITIVDTTNGHVFQAVNTLGEQWLLIRQTAFNCP